MPNGSGGTLDVSGDVGYMFDQFNDVAAYNPFFYFTSSQSQADVLVYSYYEQGIVARGGSTDANGNGLYESGELKLSTAVSWPSHSSARSTLCHEIDHIMGLNHVWWSNSSGANNVGSKATCIGMGSDTGPRIDDTSALSAVYSGVVP
jgi:hypothetical protein